MLAKSVKIIGLIAIVGTGGFIGFRLGHGTSALQSNSTDASKPGDSNGGLPVETVTSQGAPPNAAADAGRAPASIAPAQKPAPGSYEAMVADRGLAKKNQALSSAFPDTEAGHRLARLATLLQYGPAQSSAEGQLVGSQVEWLKEHPDDAFSGIREGLGHVAAADYGHERQYLIQFASQLDVDEHSKMDFLTSQLNGAADTTGTFDRAAALSAMMQNVHDADGVESALRLALKNQPDEQTRSMLLSMYEAHEPDRAQKLKADLGLTQ